MFDYILANTKEIPSNGKMIKTIVTSELGRAVAEHYGIQSIDVLTGFKFISEKLMSFNKQMLIRLCSVTKKVTVI